MHTMYYPGSYPEFLIYPGKTGLYPPHWGKPLGPIPGPGEMKVSQLIKYQYQAGMEVLSPIHNRYGKREILVQHPQY